MVKFEIIVPPDIAETFQHRVVSMLRNTILPTLYLVKWSMVVLSTKNTFQFCSSKVC